MKPTFVALVSVLLLAGCGGSASPPPASAPPSSPAAAPSKPVANTSASAPASASTAAKTSTAASASTAAKASTAASPGTAASGAGAKIVASYSELSPANLQMWIAQDGGYFTKNGLNVDMRLIESSTGVAAVVSNEIQIGQLGGSEAVAADIGGAGLAITAVLSPVLPYTFLVAPAIKTKQDIMGKKVGVSKIGSSSDTALRAGLKAYGLDPNKDVSVLSLGSRSAQTTAALNGNVQGELSHPPDSIDLEAHGWHVLFDMTQLGLSSANTTVIAKSDWVSSHKDVMQKYIDSIVEAEGRAKQDKVFAEKVLQKYMKINDPKALDETYDFYVNHVLAVLPEPKPEQFTDALQQLGDKNPKAKTFDVSKVLDGSFVKNAAQQGLDKKI